jgi:hypothetical protein
MKDDRRRPPLAQDHLEKQMGHKLYGQKRNWGTIAILLVLSVVVGGLVLYWIFEG